MFSPLANTPPLGTKPTLPELLKFTCTDRRVLNVPVEIETKYVKLGAFLLDDSTGSKVKIMAHKHHYDAERINTEIIHEWLTENGKQPVNWKTLVEVLRDIELSGHCNTFLCAYVGDIYFLESQQMSMTAGKVHMSNTVTTVRCCQW